MGLRRDYIGLAALALYLATAAPTVTLIDSGELILAAHVLGNPHSPGYPVYTPLLHLAQRLPLGDVAYRSAIFSALAGALACLTGWLLPAAMANGWPGMAILLLVLFASLIGILAAYEPPVDSATVRLAPGSVIKMLDGDDVAVDNLFSGTSAFSYGTGITAYVPKTHTSNNAAKGVVSPRGLPLPARGQCVSLSCR